MLAEQHGLVAAAAAAAVVTCSYLSYRAGLRSAAKEAALTPPLPTTSSSTSSSMPQRGTTYFLSGVMGGSGGGTSHLAGIKVESQDYRAQLRAAILAADPPAVIVDPADVVSKRAPELHPSGTPPHAFWSEDAAVGTMFDQCVVTAAQCDVVVSYLPTASMGSAIELHAAREAGKLVLVVAPGSMKGNWVVRSFAHHVFEDVPALQTWLEGQLRNSGPTPVGTTKPLAVVAAPCSLDGTITFVYSRDVEASRRFYAEGLGLRVRSDKGVVVFYALPGRATSLGVVQEGVSAAVDPPCSAKTAGRDSVMLCLLTRDVEAVLGRCAALALPGVTIEQSARANERFGIYNALLRDPDGYLVELQTFIDHAEHARFCAA